MVKKYRLSSKLELEINLHNKCIINTITSLISDIESLIIFMYCQLNKSFRRKKIE